MVQLSVCAPGLYTHIEDTANSLITEASIERCLAEFRTLLIRQYADKYVVKHQISEGDSIHVYNAFLVYASNEGLAPLSQVTKIADPFIAANTGIDEQDVIDFFNYFYHSYTPAAIVNSIAISFYLEHVQINGKSIIYWILPIKNIFSR